ncbi:MAG: uroporphyrinogen decarboxylase family protein [Armatimonadota bacterium]
MTDRYFSIPVEPDFNALKDNLLRKGTPKRVHYLDLYQDMEIKELLIQRYGIDDHLDKGSPDYAYLREIELQKFLGYDVVCGPLNPHLIWPMPVHKAVNQTTQDSDDLGEQQRGARYWQDEHDGVIQTWEDFDNYLWPDPHKANLSTLDWAEKNLDPRMKLYASSHSLFEFTSIFMGYEHLCISLYDQPDLVDAVFQKIGEIQTAYAKYLCDYDCVGMLFGGDDMGYKTGLLINKEVLVEKTFPWYKKMAELAHSKGKPFIIHNCGNIESIMEEFIEDVKIDGRQSFEDVITPVTEAKRLYGDRIAVIGGMDMDFMTRATPDQVRARVRDTLDVCMPGGGYAMGLGNTVSNYIPIENYLAMLDESRKYTA